MSGTTAPSANEALKESSRHLRGTLAEELADDADRFSGDANLLLKFHGIYQQDDRDQRRVLAQAKKDLAYSCMVRTGLPGGVLTAEQYLVLDDLAVDVCGGAMRVTTRQDIQFHFVHKADLRDLVSTLNDHLVTTLAACGDVVRNTVCCPAPLGPRWDQLLAHAEVVAAHLKPKTRSYWELWVDGDKAVTAEAPPDEEPFYGETYLPRKFKIGLAWPGDNCVDVYAEDLGIVLTGDDGAVFLVGGGLGMSHADDTTYPRLASPLGWVPTDQLLPAIEAVIAVQRDHGNRADRHHARLKYLLDDKGIDWFRGEVEARWGQTMGPVPELPEWHGSDDHLGWHRQARRGRWFLGVFVPDGRLRDTEGVQLRSALRAIVERFGCGVRLTARQDVLLTDIATKDKAAVEAILRDHHVTLAEDLTPLRRQSMACPALPTCGQALGEAERIMPAVIDTVQQALDRTGLGQLEIHLRMTGCPNGCARPYNAEIGVVGRTKSTYDLWVGGSQAGTRLARRLVTGVKGTAIGETLEPVLERYRDERSDGESFGDFCHRARIGEVLIGVAG